MKLSANIVDLSLDLSDILTNQDVMSLEIAKLGHVGTHIDIADSAGLPLQSFVTQGVVIDVSAVGDREICLADLPRPAMAIQTGQSVLFRTNWLAEKQYGRKEYFSGHPYFAYDIFDYLIEKEVPIIGVDAPGMRRAAEHKVLDEYCVARGLYILENVNQMQCLPVNQPFTLYCFPLSLKRMTGATCRSIASW